MKMKMKMQTKAKAATDRHLYLTIPQFTILFVEFGLMTLFKWALVRGQKQMKLLRFSLDKC